MRKEILHERALNKFNRRDFRRKTTEYSRFTGFAANQFRQQGFTCIDDYKQFIADNPQYPKNHYSHDAGGKSFNIDFKTSQNGDDWQIQNKQQTGKPAP